MNLTATLLFLASAPFAFSAPSEQDRNAILAMAGNYDVSFEFEEIVPIAPDYKPLSVPYHEDAFETVVIAEDTPERIVLQHLLVVEAGEKPRIIKHWAQIWTWQDTQILDYSGSEGSDHWNRIVVSEDQAKGKWSQLVTNVDDTPRYEALGKWTHEAGESAWTSELTRRPLPRREYTKRKDYDYLLGTNRHALTANGWVHTQDNRKVVDRDGRKQVLSYESGLNLYQKSESPLSKDATAWWEKKGAFWAKVRNFWLDAAQKEGPAFSYERSHDGTTLSAKFSELEEAAPSSEEIEKSLSPYLTTKN